MMVTAMATAVMVAFLPNRQHSTKKGSRRRAPAMAMVTVKAMATTTMGKDNNSNGKDDNNGKDDDGSSGNIPARQTTIN